MASDEVAGIKIKDQDAIQIMKDYMANGRFSRGVEVIANASMAFVGNIDESIHQLVNSTEHDLFLPLPAALDLAVMDRFYCYLPGWEIPKNSSAYLTGDYGFTTDYLAEAFHHVFKQTNRYEYVNSHIKLGSAVEGRDEKAIKKTVAAFLKILHPGSEPEAAELEEYVAYAVEARRRVKEQMNKRKPDDEFALINLSFFRADGSEVVVYCPESKDAPATQTPSRRSLGTGEEKPVPVEPVETVVNKQPVSGKGKDAKPVEEAEKELREELREQHFTILYGDTGYTYDSMIGPYLVGAKSVTIEDPYIRMPHQIANFVRFCETVSKQPSVRQINLVTSYDDRTDLADLNDKLDELKQSLLETDVVLDVKVNENLHDREIRIDNGWVIKIGRGLDFYQRTDS